MQPLMAQRIIQATAAEWVNVFTDSLTRVACSRLSGHIQPSKRVYFTLQRSWKIKLVRPLSTVGNTRDYARVSHSRQWSNYNVTVAT